MLYVVLTHPKQHTTREVIWYVGNKNPFHQEGTMHALPLVTEVQADGHELDWILANFVNLPHADRSKHAVQNWYGDLAKMIAVRLKPT